MFYRIVLIISILTYSSTAIADNNDFDNAIKADQLLKESIEAKKFQNFELALSKLQIAYHQLILISWFSWVSIIMH